MSRPFAATRRLADFCCFADRIWYTLTCGQSPFSTRPATPGGENAMTATYFRHGAGRSINARVAEGEGRCPLSRAKKIVAEQFGCTQIIAAAALDLLHDGEWHHVGRYAAECAYYDTTDERLAGAIAHIIACGGAKRFAARRAALKRERSERWWPESSHGN